ncbi:Retrovirus-related Pol polyprotein from transposon TNT 1-94-like protein [Drosera capensis]
MSSIRLVLTSTGNLDLEEADMDVGIAFLHGDLEGEIYMDHLKSFKVIVKEDYVFRLWISLYGLKQARRQWYKMFELDMRGHDYKKTVVDHCVFVQKFAYDFVIILLFYVTDMLIFGSNIVRISLLEKQLTYSCLVMVGVVVSWSRSFRSLVLEVLFGETFLDDKLIMLRESALRLIPLCKFDCGIRIHRFSDDLLSRPALGSKFVTTINGGRKNRTRDLMSWHALI